MKKIKVLVIDDSAVFRSLISEIIASDPDLEVVGCAEDPFHARELIKKLNPDVLTLDIEMPKMNGVQFLKNLMRLRPMPVVMISTLTQHGAEATLIALELGAVDYFPKPSVHSSADLLTYRKMVNEKIKIAAQAHLTHDVKASQAIQPLKQRSAATKLIAIGASTGGTEAVKQVLNSLPVGLPPIVITQHISGLFSKAWAERLNKSSQLNVQELKPGETALQDSHVYVAAGDQHLVVIKRHGQLFAKRQDSEPVNRHKPSVDVMFESVVESVGGKAIGVLLTGMGCDGAEGLAILHQAGAVTIAQDEKSSVVWGMPRVAIEKGAVNYVKPLNQIAELICQQLNQDSMTLTP